MKDSLYPPWIDAEEQDPPYTEYSKRYLVILKSNAIKNHAKDFAGCGEPEIAWWCNNYEGPYKWNCRGTLVVAYWMPLPKFDKKYIKGFDGEQAKWL